MLAAARAELLVLRKWPAAWGVLLVMPAAVLFTYYLIGLVQYLTVTPAQYAQEGTPAQQLPPLLPAQFVIVTLEQFSITVAPVVVLGAVMAGGDWTRGTIGTSLVAGPTRVQAWAGQVTALTVALAASVLATFAVSGGASLVIRSLAGHTVNPVDGAMPTAWVMARALGVAMLIVLAYGSMGLLLGTVCRSAAGGIAVALLWTVLTEPHLYDLGTEAGGTLQKIADFFPMASTLTLSSLFGSVGGGSNSQMDLPIRPSAAAWALAGYTALFLGLTLVLIYRRDVLTGRPRTRRRVRPAAPPASAARRTVPVLRSGPGWATGVLASLRAELLVMRHRPAVLALILAMPVNMLISSYLTDYVYYRTAGVGGPGSTSVSGPLVLPGMLPSQYLTAGLNGFGVYSSVYGPAVFFLIGALVAGSDWGQGTIRTALLQSPGRLQARVGQDLAVLIAAAAGVALTFALAAAAAAGIAADLAGSAPPLDAQFPAAAHVAVTVTGALLVGLACTAIGLTLGTVLRSATRAAAAVLLWVVVIQPSLDQLSSELHGVLLRLYEILPDAAINTVVNLYNPNTTFVAGTTVSPPSGLQLTPALAFLTLGLYIAAFLTAAAVITVRRNVT